MTAAALIARCARDGIALFLRDDRTVGFRSDRPIPAALLALAREGKATIAAALPALLADPEAPCPACAARLFWRYSGVAGPAGAWLCQTCTPPAPGQWIDATAFPLPRLTEAALPREAAPDPTPPAKASPPPLALHATPPDRRPVGVAAIRDTIAATLDSFDASPSAPCPTCAGRAWWRYRSEAGGSGPWLCRACDAPDETAIALHEINPAGAPAIAPISAPSTPDDRGFAAVAIKGGAAAHLQRQEPNR